MAELLTFNGIPPQVVGSLNEREQQVTLRKCAKLNGRCDFHGGRNSMYPIKPFLKIATSVTEKFIQWGAVLRPSSTLSLIGSYLEPGQTTFKDLRLHADLRDARKKLLEENVLILRLLSVSHTEADFIDFTGEENRNGILDKYRTEDRFYDKNLLTLAESENKIVKPRPWDTIAFDADTPHDPKGVPTAGHRILQSGWLELQLPKDWREKVRVGDVPRLHL